MPVPRNPIFRVVLTGAECTGKTALAHALAAHFDTAAVPEAARVYADQVDRPLSANDVAEIAATHHKLVANARPRHGLLILDTDLVSTVAYARHYYGAAPPDTENQARENLADLYLMTDFVPWADEPGQRDSPEVRAAVQHLIREYLAELGVTPVEISGHNEERLQASIRAIETARTRMSQPKATDPS